MWKHFGIQPHRSGTFKFSTDPQLDAKVRDIVGLYLGAPVLAARRRCLRMGSSPSVVVERRLSEAVHRVDSTCSGERTSVKWVPPTGFEPVLPP